MSYENRFNELTVNIVDKRGEPLFRFEMSVNYVDADTMATPDVDVRFITKPTNDFEDGLQDQLTAFVQNVKNREKFLTENELTVVFDHSFSFEKDNTIEKVCSDVKCPFCNSDEIEGSEINLDVGECSQDMFCIECEKEWTNIYRLETFVTD